MLHCNLCVNGIRELPAQRRQGVSFHEDRFPDPAGLIAYVERLQGTARLRPDMKLVINRAWGDPQSRLNGLLQLTKGLSGIVRKAEKRDRAAA
jgi:transcription-repair coupling factor (superfamily II helicase)